MRDAAHLVVGAAEIYADEVLPLAAVGPADVASVGGKAAGLGALIAAGLPVPDGVVVPAGACHALLAGAGLADAPGELARRSSAPPSADEAGWLAAVRGRVRAAPVPPGLARGLREALGAALDGGAPLAVRSSGTLEDLAHASFAGQYDSVVGVRGEAALHDALRACVASLFGDRLVAYLRARGGGDGHVPRMAVVVQRFVDPTVAGVLFTVNPLTGREEETVIEAVLGLGEALVSGRAAADRIVVAAADRRILERRTGTQAARARLGPGGVCTEPLAPEEGARPKLGDEEALALAELGARAQEHLGRPLDLEWVLADGELHLVQARPITRLHFAADLGEWTTADFRDGGVSADVCSPLMWSLYELAFDRSMPAYLRSLGLLGDDHRAKWSRMFFARPYWNVAEAKAAVLPLPGFVERNFDVDLGIVPTYEGPGRTTAVTIRSLARALPVLARLRRGYRRRLAANARFVDAFPARAARFDLDPAALGALAPDAFAQGWRALVEGLFLDTETGYFETIYNTSNAKLEFSVAFARANAREGGLDYGKLVGGLTDLSHLRPVRDLHRLLGRIREEGRALRHEDVEAFARRWPHRGRRELDLRVPRWPEDLPFVRATMERALATWRAEDDPDLAARAQRAVFEAERARALAALARRPWARAAFQRRLGRLRRLTWWREEMRDRSSRVYALSRRWALEAGRRLSAAGALPAADDVFLLRREEVAAALEGALLPDEVRSLARAGARLVRSFRNFQNPNEIGARHDWAEVEPAPGATALRGTPCAPGRGRGRTRVARSIEEAQAIRPGEVLVAPFTDPGWTALFPRLAAVVTETGGLLSHAAVIAREYGIPAVLGVPDVTRRVRDGSTLLVDGGRGTVEVAPGDDR